MSVAMQFKKGTEVLSSDGHRVGRVDRVVLDPRTDELIHVVVEKGFLFTTDKIVPIQLVATATEERITLKQDSQELGSLPDFVDVEYVRADRPKPDGDPKNLPLSYPSPMYWNPPIGSIWAGGGGYRGSWGLYAYPSPPYVTREVRNIPEHAVVLDEGARVVAKDGHHVGNVEEILTDPDTDRVTHLVVSRGLLNTTKKLLPITWLAGVEDGEIHLAVAAQVVETLDDYQPENA